MQVNDARALLLEVGQARLELRDATFGGDGGIVGKQRSSDPSRSGRIVDVGRTPREDEGRHYHFVGRGKFDEMAEAGGFLEWADIFGERYGTPREPIDRALAEGRDVLVEIDVQGARQVKAAEPEAYMVFITPPSLQELERRLRTRGSETDQQIRRRLAKARDELAAEPEFDVTVVNDDLETAAREVVEIVDRLRRRTINGGHTRVKERKH